MTIYTCNHNGVVVVVVGSYGKGHAVSLIAKELKKRGVEFAKTIPVETVEVPDGKPGVLAFEAKAEATKDVS